MGEEYLPVGKAPEFLEKRMNEICSVSEWAETMGYLNAKTFSRKFRNYYGIRPGKMLNTLKSLKGIELLTTTDKTVYEIGHCELGIGDEKAFWQFMKYHTGHSPREIRALNNEDSGILVEKLRSKFRE